ncbi:maleylacetoacetate isomerase [Emcibacter nanhaiensis]|uniref:Maleylacetoacetate isomerase n=1 Tax=Emcibacter nanhaiensis TaxID=1505037 RepID=A0A501PFI0_9PROT|nr:maleylacetoacetate isomerase [Emcibacter nanhaiensis]TPD59219.1 maleylacetoacetate isomerase [Emcibacter nanhaiensis]
MLALYGYYRSSAAYRLRIALNLKGLEYENIPVSLLAGEHRNEEYLKLNAQGLVPALKDGGLTLGQSMAILEYLEETRPEVPLLPADAAGRARVRQIANIIACDIHPLDNLRVLKYLKGDLGISDEAKEIWYRHWIRLGFEAIEAMLQDGASGRYCHGDTPTMAEACLIPQLYNARRFNTPLDEFPTILRIEELCNSQDPFIRALPENQPDAS